MTDLYNVVVQGKAVDGRDDKEVQQNLAKIFKEPLEKMGRLLSGKKIIVKKSVSHEQANKIIRMLEKAGAECKVVKIKKKIPQELVMEESNQSDYDSKVEDNISSDREDYKDENSQEVSNANPYITPSANLIESNKEGAAALAEFNKVSTWIVLLLTMLTCGVYAFFWLYSRTKILNRLPSVEPISSGFMVTTIILWAISMLFSFGTGINTGIQGEPDVGLTLITNLLSIVASILPIVWYFKFKNRLNTFLTNHVQNGSLLGPIMTFFFNILYLSYKLNENIEIMEGQI
ncbi:MAG: DUF4234 domain-containing protein [Desulfobacteraceae bacterium]|nr:DUF4234 domain-containing protein [Desulfobacteraceae bacterium]